ncbi:40-kDa huntingtin-associated protein [Tribolium madens]|uniref:40-kDa huntingtin-associated protein n=1 Tax=Tribolium madens TaxID=41895 RepID=UPI001CF72CF8|nr:40-kDa huntingtin-associated protein [Tribolium madens]
MSLEPSGADILEQYHTISSKLKKRFLRKPNVTEACESFSSLGKQCEASELPSYAGLCWISSARCEGSLGNTPGEAACLTRAARQFLSAERKDHELGCPSPCQENLEAAVGCFAYAASRYPDDSPLPIGLNLELVEFLTKIDKGGDVEDHLLNTVELAKDNFDTKIFCLELLASHYIESRDYTGALNTYNDIVSIVELLPLNGARAETVLKCEVSRVLLLLILRPAPQKLPPNLAKLLEKYTWGDQNDKGLKACGMSQRMFILLQSLVAACQSLDTSNLDHLENELWKMVGKEERELLRILVQIYLDL